MRPTPKIASLAALIGCGQAPPPEVPEPAPVAVELPRELRRCQPYADDPPVLAYCVAGHAMGAWRTPVDVICEHAGAYDDLCRQNWVVEAAEKDSTLSLEELLPACGSDQDCLFEVLDTRIPLDPLAAAARCTPTVPRHEQDCLGHSLAWWAATTWDPESIQQVLSFGERFPDTVGFHVGTLVGCRGVGTCPQEGELKTWCERRVRQVKRDQKTCQQRGGPKLVLQRPGDPSPP